MGFEMIIDVGFNVGGGFLIEESLFEFNWSDGGL